MSWTGDVPPDPRTAGSVGEFVERLRALKVWAGDPSFEELRRRSGLASSTLADALNPRRTRLPRLETVRGFVRACGVAAPAERDWESAWRALRGRSAVAIGTPTPHQIPRPAAPFVGRRDLLRQLDAVRRRQDSRRQPALVVLAGGAGTGKSALVARWAYDAAQHHPDGQLHVTLDGFTSRPAAPPAAALRIMLLSLGVPPAELPADLPGLIALYRSLTWSRRLLVVLDDARDAAQVAPLLPAGPGCLTVVTSRNRLSELVAREGAERITVPTLPEREAVALIAAIAGRSRVARERPAAARLAGLCGHLPLALRIAATYLADRPDERIEDYAAGLRAGTGAGGRHQDGWSALRQALAPSYRALDRPARALFRALGGRTRRRFSLADVTAWTGRSAAEAGRLLDALSSVHLLEPVGTDGWAMNPVVRTYAREQAPDPPPAVADLGPAGWRPCIGRVDRKDPC